MADPAPSSVDAELRAENFGLGEVEQLELIRDQVPGRDASTAVAIQRQRPRGRGRPAGALNRRNAKFRDYILSQHSHPGLALARTYDRPVELLAAELQCTLAEAAALQVRAAAELLPYIEGKQPISVDLRRRHDVVLIMPGEGVSDATVDAIAREVNEGEQIEWGDLDELPSFLGEPLQDVSRDADG